LSTDDDFPKNDLWTKTNPVESVLVRRIIQLSEHPDFLFVAPALVFCAQKTINYSGVDSFWSRYDVGLVVYARVVIGTGFSFRDIKTKAHASVGLTIVTPQQKIVPVPAKTEKPFCSFPPLDMPLYCPSEVRVRYVNRTKIEWIVKIFDLRSSIFDSLSRPFCKLPMACPALPNLYTRMLMAGCLFQTLRQTQFGGWNPSASDQMDRL